MSLFDDLKGRLSTKVGPLPVWAYGAIGATGVVILMKVSGKTPAIAGDYLMGLPEQGTGKPATSGLFPNLSDDTGGPGLGGPDRWYLPIFDPMSDDGGIITPGANGSAPPPSNSSGGGTPAPVKDKSNPIGNFITKSLELVSVFPNRPGDQTSVVTHVETEHLGPVNPPPGSAHIDPIRETFFGPTNQELSNFDAAFRLLNPDAVAAQQTKEAAQIAPGQASTGVVVGKLADGSPLIVYMNTPLPAPIAGSNP